MKLDHHFRLSAYDYLTVESAIREGNQCQAEPDDGDELTDAYNQVRRELDAEDDVSECGGALGATTTINTDGRRYHPACARGVVRPNSLRHRIQKSLGGSNPSLSVLHPAPYRIIPPDQTICQCHMERPVVTKWWFRTASSFFKFARPRGGPHGRQTSARRGLRCAARFMLALQRLLGRALDKARCRSPFLVRGFGWNMDEWEAREKVG